ncbi:MAG: HypC/HybG/HupF family hydrogenase formation chaperone [Spirochaetota bacterium]|nr:HypC/HybG/HupF family hydrogenase formation chaperone [Spirochaetota bacterium]
MCLAVPGRVIETYDESGMLMGRVDYDGIVNKVCLAYTPEAEVGVYVIVHAGFAISILNEEEARKSLELWDEISRREL